MRKTDQELMWEVFMEASNGGVITTGGPLKAGGGSSAPKSSDEDEDDVDGDPYEDEEGEEGEDKLKSVLDKCHNGDITADEAHKHITKMMKGSKPKEEDAENVKRDSAGHNTLDIMRQMSPHKPGSRNKFNKSKMKQHERELKQYKDERKASQKGLRQGVRRKGGDMSGI